MKKWIAILTLAAMLLALACSALAEAAKEPWEIPVTEEELLGVWQADGNAGWTTMIPMRLAWSFAG